jgi:hypothetical protein
MYIAHINRLQICERIVLLDCALRSAAVSYTHYGTLCMHEWHCNANHLRCQYAVQRFTLTVAYGGLWEVPLLEVVTEHVQHQSNQVFLLKL